MNRARKKKCKVCESEFKPVSSVNIYCSRKCKRIAEAEKRSKKPPVKKCGFCGDEYKPYTSLDKFCSVNCRVENMKSKRSKRWNDDSVNKRTGELNPAYRNGNYVRGKKRSGIGEREFIRNSKEMKAEMVNDVGYVYCQHCSTSRSIKYETHHLIFRSEKPKHETLHKKKNLIVLCIKCHNEFHKAKGTRDEVVRDRRLDEVFGIDVLDKSLRDGNK